MDSFFVHFLSLSRFGGWGGGNLKKFVFYCFKFQQIFLLFYGCEPFHHKMDTFNPFFPVIKNENSLFEWEDYAQYHFTTKKN